MYGFYKCNLCVKIKAQFCSFCLQKQQQPDIQDYQLFCQKEFEGCGSKWSSTTDPSIHPSSSILRTRRRDYSSSKSPKDWPMFVWKMLLAGSCTCDYKGPMGPLVLLELYISWLESWLRPSWFYHLLKFHWHQSMLTK